MNVKPVVVGTYNGKVFVITDHRASIASPTVARKSSWGVRHYCLRLRGTNQVLRYVVPDTPGTFPCNRGRCNTCPVVSYDKNLSIVGPNNNRFNVHQHFTCTSANVVYVLVCKRCNILYVGETKRRLADRVTEHLRSIKQNLPGFPVATHFNPPSTCSIRDLMVSAAISCRGSDHDRLAAENRLIMKLGTLSPHGLNVRLELL
ncbi:hypothetical protein HOLleu_02801 [Holothuria leucospilota]|uniref:GIY-YIG domain-containing protein n=1 Tax=Holothuria leucospilota TaxID=206669 RepID=A0A9Q1HLL7_HOLLE|nr:hypothetical protein HOLleu_02801 [Holothuria leucospilota]